MKRMKKALNQKQGHRTYVQGHCQIAHRRILYNQYSALDTNMVQNLAYPEVHFFRPYRDDNVYTVAPCYLSVQYFSFR